MKDKVYIDLNKTKDKNEPLKIWKILITHAERLYGPYVIYEPEMHDVDAFLTNFIGFIEYTVKNDTEKFIKLSVLDENTSNFYEEFGVEQLQELLIPTYLSINIILNSEISAHESEICFW